MRRPIAVLLWALSVYIIAGAIIAPEVWGAVLGIAAAYALLAAVKLWPLWLAITIGLVAMWYVRRRASRKRA